MNNRNSAPKTRFWVPSNARNGREWDTLGHRCLGAIETKCRFHSKFEGNTFIFITLRKVYHLGSALEIDDLSHPMSLPCFIYVAEKDRLIIINNSGSRRALKAVEVLVTTMSKSSKIVAVLLSLTLAVIAGLNLSSPQVKHVLSTVASAVWGS
jgi:hypothetical protein